MLSSRKSLVLLVAVMLPGPWCAMAAQLTARAEEQDHQPFSITITALNAEIKVGEEAFLKIRLKNESQEDIQGGGVFRAEGLDTSYRYDCHNDPGISVMKEIVMVGSAHEAPILKLGESHEETIPLGRACDFSKPGAYVIQLSRSDIADPKHHAIKSNEITITVTP
jgi:hypothetical protein